MLAIVAVEDLLERNHVDHLNWHQTLNATLSTRPNERGGKIVRSVTKIQAILIQAVPDEPGNVFFAYLIALLRETICHSALNAKAKPKTKLEIMLVVESLPT